MRSIYLLLLGTICLALASCSSSDPRKAIAGKWENTRGNKETLEFAEDGTMTVSVRQAAQSAFKHGVIRGKYKFVSDKQIEITLDGKSAVREAQGELPIPGWLPISSIADNMPVRANVTITKDKLTVIIGDGKPEEYARPK
jgi:hypothetical protein